VTISDAVVIAQRQRQVEAEPRRERHRTDAQILDALQPGSVRRRRQYHLSAASQRLALILSGSPMSCGRYPALR
jgi:hypothetical protein